MATIRLMPTAFTPFDWYEQPEYYDIIFDADTEQEAAFVEAAHHEYGRPRGRDVLEPASGTGRLLAAMADRGFRALGFDRTPGMVEYAERRLAGYGDDARTVFGDMADFRFRRRFDLAFNLVSTFKLLTTGRQAAGHLRCVSAHLRPGGIYLLGLHTTDYADRRQSRERWVAERDGTHVVCTINGRPPDEATRLEPVRARLVVTEAGRTRRLETHWNFRAYDVDQLKGLLRRAPDLELVAVHDFGYEIEEPGTLDDDRYDHLLVLRKR